VECVLANVWSQAFGINRIGVHDSFYDLGGDSIIASRIVSAISRIFPWELTMAEFYDGCSIAATARTLIEKAPTKDTLDKVAAIFLQVEAMSALEVETKLAEERRKRPTLDE
jgi:enterobactin synthetase component F